MGFLKDQHGKPKSIADEALDIFEIVQEGMRNERSPAPTPARVKLGLGMIRFGIRLLKKIV